MKKIKVAFIGQNILSHSTEILASIKKQSDIFEIAGYNLPENEKEKYPQKCEGLEGLTELTLEQIMNNPEIEAVIVETDEIYLTKYATLAAKHGKHIHMEKPGGTSLPEFEELIENAKKNKIVFHTGYMYRYNPYVQELLAKVKNGDLGEINSVEAQMNCYHRPKSRQWLKDFPGGMMFFLGCHLIDLILQINGTPEEIIPYNCSSGIDGVTAEDFGMVVLRYKNGVSFAKTTAVEIGGVPRRQLVVSGSLGTVEIRPLEEQCGDNLITKKTEHTRGQGWHDKGISATSEEFNRYDNMMASFAEMVRGEKENPWSYDYELMLYRTILKCCGR